MSGRVKSPRKVSGAQLSSSKEKKRSGNSGKSKDASRRGTGASSSGRGDGGGSSTPKRKETGNRVKQLKDGDDERCQLCNEVFDTNPVRQSGGVNNLPCAHKFHNGCIAKWMFMNDNICPICGRLVDMECDSDSEPPPRLKTPSGLRQSVRAAEEAQLRAEEALARADSKDRGFFGDEDRGGGGGGGDGGGSNNKR